MLIDSILGKIGLSRVEKNGPGHLPGDDTIYKSFSQLMGKAGVKDPYSQVVWVYASVKKIATNISGVPFKLVTEGTDGEDTEVEEGPLVDLFDNPNPFMTKTMLWEATQTYLDLRGQAFWVMPRENITQVPEGIWLLDPNNFRAVLNTEKSAIIGWVYEGQKKIPFQTHEIIQFKYFDPNNPVGGQAPYRSIATIADQEYFANLFNTAFFKNGAAVGGFIQVPQVLNDKQWNRLVNQFEDRHQSAGKAHKIGILEKDMKFQEAKLSQKDMDFIKNHHQVLVKQAGQASGATRGQ